MTERFPFDPPPPPPPGRLWSPWVLVAILLLIAALALSAIAS
jgi:hypothetical protein